MNFRIFISVSLLLIIGAVTGKKNVGAEIIGGDFSVEELGHNTWYNIYKIGRYFI